MAQIEQMRYDSIWKNASNEQKLAQAKKEGQEAYAKAQSDASAENLLALEKARAKYNSVIDDMKGGKSVGAGSGASSDVLATGGRTRNEQGKLTRNGVVVSEEDAARTDKTKADNKLESGAISKEEHISLLKEIRDSLKPKGK